MLKEVSRVKLLVESDKEYRSSYQGHQGFVKIFLAFLAYFFFTFLSKVIVFLMSKGILQLNTQSD